MCEYREFVCPLCASSISNDAWHIVGAQQTFVYRVSCTRSGLSMQGHRTLRAEADALKVLPLPPAASFSSGGHGLLLLSHTCPHAIPPRPCQPQGLTLPGPRPWARPAWGGGDVMTQPHHFLSPLPPRSPVSSSEKGGHSKEVRAWHTPGTPCTFTKFIITVTARPPACSLRTVSLPDLG